jgi:plasmid stabilization system protein ParE
VAQLQQVNTHQGDLDDIADFIAQDNPLRAVTFIKDIRTKFYDIQRDKLVYQLRPEIGEAARRATVGNYAILFRVTGEVVRIDRVTYGNRDLPSVLDLKL